MENTNCYLIEEIISVIIFTEQNKNEKLLLVVKGLLTCSSL